MAFILFCFVLFYFSAIYKTVLFVARLLPMSRLVVPYKHLFLGSTLMRSHDFIAREGEGIGVVSLSLALYR